MLGGKSRGRGGIDFRAAAAGRRAVGGRSVVASRSGPGLEAFPRAANQHRQAPRATTNITTIPARTQMRTPKTTHERQSSDGTNGGRGRGGARGARAARADSAAGSGGCHAIDLDRVRCLRDRACFALRLAGVGDSAPPGRGLELPVVESPSPSSRKLLSASLSVGSSPGLQSSPLDCLKSLITRFMCARTARPSYSSLPDGLLHSSQSHLQTS
mmetsp:Transcript_3869/g.16045  ORF Transcript_3869/g.16045 Transcript_3869/m.16045 type:complete len:214 (-) Transcript_3869:618-1259(-)